MKIFLQGPIEYEIFLPIDGTLKVLNLNFRVDQGVMAIKDTPHFLDLKNWRVTIWCRLVSTPGHHFLKGVYPHCRGYSQRILSPTRKTKWKAKYYINDVVHTLITTIIHSFYLCGYIYKSFDDRQVANETSAEEASLTDNISLPYGQPYSALTQ